MRAMAAALSRRADQADSAQFAGATRALFACVGDRPGERQTHRLTTTDFAADLDDQRIIAGGKRLEFGMAVIEGQGVTARATGGTRDAVGRQGGAASDASPPAAQLVKPARLAVVPELQGGTRLAAVVLQPEGRVQIGSASRRDG